MSPVGIFGGTFDPVHYGHLRTAFEVLEELRFAEIRFVPGGDPPHRDTTFASAELRLRMVAAATAGEPRFVVDDREVRRAGPSYTVDTLESMRAEFSAVPMGLIIGMDAFLGLTTWHRWQQLLDYAHIIVAHRPGWRAPDTGPLGSLYAECRSERVEDLLTQPSGLIHVHAVTQLEISSTAIRELVGRGGDPRFLMPDAVRELIARNGCYKRLEPS
jgi:nicotinate-nucleotide adenylyltransferase